MHLQSSKIYKNSTTKKLPFAFMNTLQITALNCVDVCGP